MRRKPITLRAANAFVAEHHRHSASVRGCAFCISVIDDDGQLLGVAIAGRPLARVLDDGMTIEVLRVCTLGGRNVASMLYGGVCKAARAIGYCTAITYTLERELGVSLRASGFTAIAKTKGRRWVDRASGAPLLTAAGIEDPRRQDFGDKVRWERRL